MELSSVALYPPPKVGGFTASEDNRAEYWEHRIKLMRWWADIVSGWID